jgi:hypothetical protein
VTRAGYIRYAWKFRLQRLPEDLSAKGGEEIEADGVLLETRPGHGHECRGVGLLDAAECLYGPGGLRYRGGGEGAC